MKNLLEQVTEVFTTFGNVTDVGGRDMSRTPSVASEGRGVGLYDLHGVFNSSSTTNRPLRLL